MDSLERNLEDENAVYAIKKIRKKYVKETEKLFSGRTFNSKAELEEYLREEVSKLLLSEADLLRGRISDLRKKGGDVNYSDFHLMQVPLKIKLFSASLGKKDFDSAWQILDKVSKEFLAMIGDN